MSSVQNAFGVLVQASAQQQKGDMDVSGENGEISQYGPEVGMANK